jgi:hypothetical protein
MDGNESMIRRTEISPYLNLTLQVASYSSVLLRLWGLLKLLGSALATGSTMPQKPIEPLVGVMVA